MTTLSNQMYILPVPINK